jgi:glycogen synthase
MSRIAVLTYNSVVQDARVQRICETLAGDNHTVALISPDNDPPCRGLFRHYALPSFMKTRQDVLRSAGLMAPATLVPSLAAPLHRVHPTVTAATKALRLFAPDIIHANDWMTLPAALAEKARTGARVVYDSHEMATEEHATNLRWRLVAKAHIARLERDTIAHADRVMTVGDGLADALHQLYPHIKTRPAVVRNMPNRQQTVFRPVGSQRILSYVGLIRPERHLDLMIRSLAKLDARHRLHIMGFGKESDLQHLRTLASGLGVSDRVVWKDPVPPDQVSMAANSADIGLFLTDQKTRQQSLALPNKLFEYITAGLMVITSDTSELRNLIARTGCGLTVPELSVEALAQTLARLDDGQIDAAKRASVEASQVLNWETEAPKLLDIYRTLQG